MWGQASVRVVDLDILSDWLGMALTGLCVYMHCGKGGAERVELL